MRSLLKVGADFALILLAVFFCPFAEQLLDSLPRSSYNFYGRNKKNLNFFLYKEKIEKKKNGGIKFRRFFQISLQ